MDPLSNMGTEIAGTTINNSTQEAFNDHSRLSRSFNMDSTSIESAAQEAVLREQEIAMQQVIHSQRQAKSTDECLENDKDVLSQRHDPSALKGALLKMATDHRAEVVAKRGKSLHTTSGNVEIGNGYGVPGGGAYYAAIPLSGNLKDETHGISCEIEPEAKGIQRELPDYLKKKLKARGILKDDATGGRTTTEKRQESPSTDTARLLKLPPGWLEDLPEVDCLLITQSLDDHCHVNTLKPLSKMRPDLRVIATQNAESILNPMFRNVAYLEPGQNSQLEGRNGMKLNIRATAGPILGPPWQRPENGYIITFGESHDILYYEPHCVYNHSLLRNYQVDIIITPVIKQLLPSFTLVSGQEDAVNLAKLLQAKFIVPMKNGDLDSKGILSKIIRTEGTVESFKKLLRRELPDARVLEPTPGAPLQISLSARVP